MNLNQLYISTDILFSPFIRILHSVALWAKEEDMSLNKTMNKKKMSRETSQRVL